MILLDLFLNFLLKLAHISHLKVFMQYLRFLDFFYEQVDRKSVV